MSSYSTCFLILHPPTMGYYQKWRSDRQRVGHQGRSPQAGNNYMHWTTGFFSNLPSVLAKEASSEPTKPSIHPSHPFIDWCC